VAARVRRSRSAPRRYPTDARVLQHRFTVTTVNLIDVQVPEPVISVAAGRQQGARRPGALHQRSRRLTPTASFRSRRVRPTHAAGRASLQSTGHRDRPGSGRALHGTPGAYEQRRKSPASGSTWTPSRACSPGSQGRDRSEGRRRAGGGNIVLSALDKLLDKAAPRDVEQPTESRRVCPRTRIP